LAADLEVGAELRDQRKRYFFGPTIHSSLPWWPPLAEKKRVRPTAVRYSGLLPALPRRRSLTIRVPLRVPLLRHGDAGGVEVSPVGLGDRLVGVERALGDADGGLVHAGSLARMRPRD
jgi:hypothetical protein